MYDSFVCPRVIEGNYCRPVTVKCLSLSPTTITINYHRLIFTKYTRSWHSLSQVKLSPYLSTNRLFTGTAHTGPRNFIKHCNNTLSVFLRYNGLFRRKKTIMQQRNERQGKLTYFLSTGKTSVNSTHPFLCHGLLVQLPVAVKIPEERCGPLSWKWVDFVHISSQWHFSWTHSTVNLDIKK